MVSTARKRRGFFGGGRWGAIPPAVLLLIILEVVIYLASGIATNFVPSVAGAFSYLPMDYRDVLQGEAWRLVTYGLLHSLYSPFHLLVNALMLYFFGRDLEQRYGPGKFMLYVWSAVLIGGIFVFAAGLLGIGSGAAIGISAATEACIVTWAFFNRNAEVRLFFVLPIKGIHMVFFALLLWLLDAVSSSPYSASAHLGGIVFGAAVYFFTARRNRLKLFFDELFVKLRFRKAPKLTVVPRGPDKWVQ